MRRAVTIFVVAGCACAFGPAFALAQTVSLTIDSKAVDLEKGDKGTYTAALGFTNLTGRAMALTAKPAKVEPGCQLVPDPAQLPAAEHTGVTIKIPAGCTVADKTGISFTVSSAAPAASFPVTAAPKPEATPKPEWTALRVFPIALVVSLVLAWFAFYFWRSSRSPEGAETTPRRRRRRAQAAPRTPEPVTLGSALEYMPDTWSFNDSWLTNITALGGLLVGLFGTSDVVKALTGKDADSAFALATVGAAAAAVLVGAAPVLLFATKTRVGDYFSVGGLLAASAITVGAAAGEIFVVWRSSTKLDLGGAEDLTWILALLIGLLLLLYAVRSVHAELDQGLDKPPKSPAPDAIVAAKLIVEALKAHEGVNQEQLDTTLREMAPSYAEIGTSPPDDYLRRRRSALL